MLTFEPSDVTSNNAKLLSLSLVEKYLLETKIIISVTFIPNSIIGLLLIVFSIFINENNRFYSCNGLRTKNVINKFCLQEVNLYQF